MDFGANGLVAVEVCEDKPRVFEGLQLCKSVPVCVTQKYDSPILGTGRKHPLRF